MQTDKPKNIFFRISEDFGLIIGGLILLFALLIGAAYLLTGPLHVSPHGPGVTYILLLVFFISFFPFWLMYRHRAEEHPREALRIYKNFLIYGIWCGISGTAGELALNIYAIMNGAFSWTLFAALIFFIIITPLVIHKFEIVQKQLKNFSGQKAW